MKSKKKKVFTLSMQGEESRFKEIFVRRIMIGDEFLTVSVIKPLGTPKPGLFVYYRAPLKIIKDFLSSSRAS